MTAAALAFVLAVAATGCGARTGLTDGAGDIDASRVDGASDASSPRDGDGDRDDAANDGGFECPKSQPAVASPCPLAGSQCFYFPPGDPQGGEIYVYYCEDGVWSTSHSEVEDPDCGNVACIQGPAQCIMGACQRCTCGSDGFYDDCGSC
jgi:hypothetical protein